MIISWVNIGQLLTGNLSRIAVNGYGSGWTAMSLFYCKFRWFAIQTCTLTSYACLCFATIDQYLVTSSLCIGISSCGVTWRSLFDLLQTFCNPNNWSSDLSYYSECLCHI